MEAKRRGRKRKSLTCVARKEKYPKSLWSSLSNEDKLTVKRKTVKWLVTCYKACSHSSIQRQVVYNHYQKFCSSEAMVVYPVENAFGKYLAETFPSVATERLGKRGQNRYHYKGLEARSSEEIELLKNSSTQEEDCINFKELNTNFETLIDSTSKSNPYSIDEIEDLAVFLDREEKNEEESRTSKFTLEPAIITELEDRLNNQENIDETSENERLQQRTSESKGVQDGKLECGNQNSQILIDKSLTDDKVLEELSAEQVIESKQEKVLCDSEETGEDEDRREDIITNEDRREDIITNEERREDIITNEDRQEDIITNEERREDIITNEDRQEDIITNEDRQEDIITNDSLKLEEETSLQPDAHCRKDLLKQCKKRQEDNISQTQNVNVQINPVTSHRNLDTEEFDRDLEAEVCCLDKQRLEIASAGLDRSVEVNDNSGVCERLSLGIKSSESIKNDDRVKCKNTGKVLESVMEEEKSGVTESSSDLGHDNSGVCERVSLVIKSSESIKNDDSVECKKTEKVLESVMEEVKSVVTESSSDLAENVGHDIVSNLQQVIDFAKSSSDETEPVTTSSDHISRTDDGVDRDRPRNCSKMTSSKELLWHDLSNEKKEEYRDWTKQWALEEYEMNPQVCIPRSVVFSHYERACAQLSIPPMVHTRFGQILQKAFKHLSMRRLGSRGESQYYCVGIDIRETSQSYHTIVKHSILKPGAKPKVSRVFNGPKKKRQ